MLILTRRPGETITIGKNAEIRVTVLGVGRNQVRLGIQADPSVPVDREEIRAKKVADGTLPRVPA